MHLNLVGIYHTSGLKFYQDKKNWFPTEYHYWVTLLLNLSEKQDPGERFDSALRLSNAAMSKTTTGQIVNLLSNDVNKFDQVTIFLHFLWAGPLQAIAVTVLLWLEIGPSCLAGMAVLIILLPLQTCMGRLFSALRSRTAAFTDARIRTMNEVITGMRIIKMYAWEKSFAELVNNMRRKEISVVLKTSYLRGMNLASFYIASKITVFMTFMTYVLLGNPISASRVFVAVSLYGAVRLTVTLFFPAAIEKVSEALVSVRRIKNFLILDEVSQFRPQLKSNSENPILNVHHLTCSWDKGKEVGKGTFSDFLKSGIDFSSLLKKVEEDDQPSSPGTPSHQLTRIRTFSQSSLWSLDSSVQSQKDGTAGSPAMGPVLTALPEESRSEGKIGFTIYKKYFSAGANYFVIFILLVLNILALVTYVLQDWWLSYWANQQVMLNITKMEYGGQNITETLDLPWYLGMYAGLTVATILFSILRSLLMFHILVNAARTLHNKMFQSVLRTP
ncbi:multidrug resistance-associated protein 4, partial [Protobothrops mucrosquamatus]|uniref:multidrug resistance-associated protein 4 n=1 Tax=Protobothrops mucrosquamatus TaxID=103944 RepID=UPI0007758F8D